ncbi:hypothetical protein OEZ86_002710 [Tetradesmus obliquus]|nr:hypothetical protein OEZ86_002710 [Tetradesmus obliquus]
MQPHQVPTPSGQPPIPFYQQQPYHHHQQQQQYPHPHPQQHPQQQQQQQQQQMYQPAQQHATFAGQQQQQQPQPGSGPALSAHQAELEALKQQIAEEKRRRKERKQLKKMRKIMLQQQQQGLAHQVLYAASSQPPLPLPAGSSPRPRGLPHPAWPPAAPPHQQQQQQQQQRRQQSFSEATAAAAAAAAAAAVGSSGGSGDLSGYLGGFGSPGVYRTSSGKVLRMLTHPVTGKPLLLGPAVDAKSSRLGNTSLGAPAPQLFGMDLQATHLNSLPAPAPVPTSPYTPLPGYAQAGGLAAAAGPGFSSPGASSSMLSLQRLHRDGSIASAAAVGAAGGCEMGSGAELGMAAGYGLTQAQPQQQQQQQQQSGYGSMQVQQGLYAGPVAAGDAAFAGMGPGSGYGGAM